MRLYLIWLEEKLKPWTDGKMISRCLHQIGIISLQVLQQWFVNCFYMYVFHILFNFLGCVNIYFVIFEIKTIIPKCVEKNWHKNRREPNLNVTATLAGHGRLFYKCDMARRLDREVGNSAEFYLVSRHIIVEVCLKISK